MSFNLEESLFLCFCFSLSQLYTSSIYYILSHYLPSFPHAPMLPCYDCIFSYRLHFFPLKSQVVYYISFQSLFTFLEVLNCFSYHSPLSYNTVITLTFSCPFLPTPWKLIFLKIFIWLHWLLVVVYRIFNFQCGIFFFFCFLSQGIQTLSWGM